MVLLVDYRQGSIELLDPLKRMGLPASEGDIPADLCWEGRGEGGAPVLIGVEFKKLPELVQSLRTQRLQGHQLLKMRDNFKFCYLLVEGEVTYDGQGKLTKRIGRRDFKPLPGSMTVGELFKRLHVLHLCGGLNVIWSRSRQDTLQHLAALYRTWTDCDLDAHKSHIAIYQAPTLIHISECRTVLKGIEGVGVKLTKLIEEHFNGSLIRFWTASRDELMKIDGIGPKLADHIIELRQGRNRDRR